MSLKVLVYYHIQTLDNTLHETYHPLRTLLSKNVNPDNSTECTAYPCQPGISPLLTPLSRMHTTTGALAADIRQHIALPHQACSMIHTQAKVHSQLLSNAMFVTIPLPTYMHKFSRCPGPPHNATGAHAHCYSMGMHQGMAHARSLRHAKLFQSGKQHRATPGAHVHTHTHARMHTRSHYMYTHVHTPTPNYPMAASHTTSPGHPPTRTYFAWPL